MTFEHQSANHWGPFLEWAINNPATGPQAYDTVAKA